ncbi:MAG: hypothetical protein OXD43_10620, partial [Bacteroidetes bacterium]|nr:hypothetical protein [Bacteroidota bacterium]
GVFSEGHTKIFERAIGIAKLVGGLSGRETANKVSAQGLVLDVAAQDRLAKEVRVISHHLS